MPLPRIQRGELWVVDLGYLGKGALDLQQTAAVPAIKFVRRLGALNPEQMHKVEIVLAQVFGLKLAVAPPEP